MAQTNWGGDGPVLWDPVVATPQAPAHATGLQVDVSNEKFGVVGEVWHPTIKTGTINIRKVHYKTGAIASFNGASVWRVTVADVSGTAGPPYQPGGGTAQTYSLGAGVSPTASDWNVTGNLSADRAVDLSAVNWDDANSRWISLAFDFATFNASDSVIMQVINTAAIPPFTGLSGAPLNFNGTSWAAINNGSCVALECDDGSFAFLKNSMPFKSFNNASVSSNGAIQRAGLKFTVSVPCKLETIGFNLLMANGSDGRLVLYDTDGTTELASVKVDNDAVLSQGTGRWHTACIVPVSLTAGVAYRLAYVASNTTASTIYYGDVHLAGLMDGLQGGQAFHWTQHNGTSWADTTTRRPHFYLGFAFFDNGVGGGGGGNLRTNFAVQRTTNF